MGQIQNLPIELLLHIFTKGCEDDDLINWTIFHGRRLKPFAGLARSTCRRWRDLIDSPHPACHSHFWIARLGLSLPLSIPSLLIQSINDLRWQFNQSRGCNIAILFIWPTWEPIGTHQLVNDTTAHITNLSKSFIFGMQQILPYQRQIVSLRLRSSDPQLRDEFLRLCLQLKDAVRLVEIEFGEPERDDRTVALLSGPWTPSPRNFQGSGDGTMSLKNPPKGFLSLLPFLERLSIPPLSLLGCHDLPPNLSKLVIYDHNVGALGTFMKLFKELAQLRFRLTELAIDIQEPHSGLSTAALSTESSLVAAAQLLSFPYLRVLELRMMETWAEAFMAHGSYPLLERLSLDLKADYSSNALREAIEVMIPPPGLVDLQIMLPFNRRTGLLLRHFATSAIRVFHLKEVKRFNSATSGTDLPYLFSSNIPHLQPQRLTAENFSLSHPQLFLALLSIPCDRLEALKIIGSPHNAKEQEVHGLWYTGDLTLVAPRLAQLTLVGFISTTEVKFILSNIDTNELGVLSIELRESDYIVFPRPKFQQKSEYPGSFTLASVQHIRHQMLATQTSTLSNFWKCFPNVQSLTLNIITLCDNWTQTIQELCEALQSDPLPFPEMTTFILTFDAPMNSTVDMDSVRLSLIGALETRVTKGGRRFILSVLKSWMQGELTSIIGERLVCSWRFDTS